MSIKNIKAALAQADATDREEGLRAYARYRPMMEAIAAHYCYPRSTVVGAFAALSPNCAYVSNLRSVCSVLHGHRRGWQEGECAVATYHSNRAKAWRIINGERPLNVLTGLKTSNFFTNIMDPEHPRAITIDGHMVSIWHGKRMKMDEAKMGRKMYVELATQYRRVARESALLPSQLQAVLWFTWKRVHAVLYGGDQLDLFHAGDQWQIERPLEEITRWRHVEFTRLKN